MNTRNVLNRSASQCACTYVYVYTHKDCLAASRCTALPCITCRSLTASACCVWTSCDHCARRAHLSGPTHSSRPHRPSCAPPAPKPARAPRRGSADRRRPVRADYRVCLRSLRSPAAPRCAHPLCCCCLRPVSLQQGTQAPTHTHTDTHTHTHTAANLAPACLYRELRMWATRHLISEISVTV